METSEKKPSAAKTAQHSQRQQNRTTKPVVFPPRYRKIKPIAEGGTSTIFLADDALIPGMPVVIKAIHPQLLKEPSTQYIAAREAAIAKQLAHPGLVKVFDLHQHKDTEFLVMEYIEGESLQALSGRVHFDIDKVIAILAPLTKVLEYLHQHGVVHSDVKPSNIIITPNNKVKLIDLANCRQDTLCNSPSVRVDSDHFFGYSLDYSSPQVVNDYPATPSDDVFSLACVAYQLLEGQSPIPSNKKAVAGVPATVKKPQALSRRQWRVLQKAMSSNDKVRYQSVGRFLSDFVSAKQFKRKVLFSALTISGLIAAGSIFWSAWQSYQSELDNYKTHYEQNQRVDTLINDIRQSPPLKRHLHLSLNNDEVARQHDVLSALYADVVPPVLTFVLSALGTLTVPDYTALSTQLDAVASLYPNAPAIQMAQARVQTDKIERIEAYQADLATLFRESEYSLATARELVAIAYAIEELGASVVDSVPTPAHLVQYQADIRTYAQKADWPAFFTAFEYAQILSEVFPAYLDGWSSKDLGRIDHAELLLDYVDNSDAEFPAASANILLGQQFIDMRSHIAKTWYNKDFATRVNELLALKKTYRLPSSYAPYRAVVRELDKRMSEKARFHRRNNQTKSAGNLLALQKKLK